MARSKKDTTEKPAPIAKKHAPSGDPHVLNVQVRVSDLLVLAGMQCVHAMQGAKSCDQADIERGGCCNACWASRWALEVLKRSGPRHLAAAAKKHRREGEKANQKAARARAKLEKTSKPRDLSPAGRLIMKEAH